MKNIKQEMLEAAVRERRPSAGTLPSKLDPMPYAQWIDLALRRLQAQWPDADERRLNDIADELFTDPRSGMLEPQQAVEDWLRLLAGHD